MKERPIIMSALMVRAILEDRKTQTRRIVKPQPPSVEAVHAKAGIGYHWHAPQRGIDHWRPIGPVWAVRDLMGQESELRCPYGVPGDRLWVRENFQPLYADGFAFAQVDYETGYGYAPRYVATDGRTEYLDHNTEHIIDRVTPSIFMPRWASRITLELTEVRVERLQDMEGATAWDSDALAEGVNSIHHGDGAYYYSAFRNEPHPKNWRDPADALRELWDSLNAKRAPWVSNPWVWVLGFRRVTHG